MQSTAEQYLHCFVLKRGPFDNNMRSAMRENFTCAQTQTTGSTGYFIHPRLAERENEAADAGMVDRAGTHWAGLAAGIERCPAQNVAIKAR